MSRCVRVGIVLAGVTALAACASVPRSRDTIKVDELITARGVPAPAWPKDAVSANTEGARVAELISRPLTAERAIALAFVRNAQMRTAYAELGIAQADVIEASRIGNPTFGYISLRPRDGGGRTITRSVSLDFTDLLLLRARTHLARGELERVRASVAAELLDLSARVETAWYEYVSAQQVAEMRSAVARAGDASAEFAQRLRDAGTITPRALALALAAAGEARVAAGRAAADAIRARVSLAELMGIPARENWQTVKRLPAPLATDDSLATLTEQALSMRLDLAAVRREESVLEDALGITRRWRWLGEVDVGYERQSESAGARLRGPSLAIQVPIFNQNQAGVLRSQTALEAARARLATLELSVRNEVALGLDRLAAVREITETYRTALLPQREAVVARSQEEFNFMLIGAFELLQAKQEQFDAYQEYLEAVREYWIARTELRRAAGGRLPDDGKPAQSTIGVEELLTPDTEQMQDMDHSKMDHSQHDGPPQPSQSESKHHHSLNGDRP